MFELTHKYEGGDKGGALRGDNKSNPLMFGVLGTGRKNPQCRKSCRPSLYLEPHSATAAGLLKFDCSWHCGDACYCAFLRAAPCLAWPGCILFIVCATTAEGCGGAFTLRECASAGHAGFGTTWLGVS